MRTTKKKLILIGGLLITIGMSWAQMAKADRDFPVANSSKPQPPSSIYDCPGTRDEVAQEISFSHSLERFVGKDAYNAIQYSNRWQFSNDTLWHDDGRISHISFTWDSVMRQIAVPITTLNECSKLINVIRVGERETNLELVCLIRPYADQLLARQAANCFSGAAEKICSDTGFQAKVAKLNPTQRCNFSY